MRWQDQRQSDNVEDRRGNGRSIAIGGGGIGVLVLALAIYLCGGDPTQLLNSSAPQTVPQPGTTANKAVTQDQNRQFVGAIMGNLEDAWKQILPTQSRVAFRAPKLVLFTGQVQSACGFAEAAGCVVNGVGGEASGTLPRRCALELQRGAAGCGCGDHCGGDEAECEAGGGCGD